MSLLTNIISYWKLDESSGNATDSLGINTLTNTGTATYASAVINNGVTVNGSSQYLSANNNVVGSGTVISIGVWLKNGNASQNQDCTVLSNQKDNTGGIFVSRSTGGTANEYSLVYSNGTSYQGYGSGLFAISTSVFEYYVFIINGTSRKVYRNASLIIDDTLTGSVSFTTAQNLTLGIDPPVTAGRYWSGRYDEGGVWSRALTSGEITQLYNAGVGLSYPFGLANQGNFLTFM